MTKKIISVLAVIICTVLLFTGCSGEQLKQALSLEVDSYDPALETAADMLGREIKQEELTQGDFEYLILDDNSAVVTGYNGKDEVINIPGELDGHIVVGLENKALYQSEMTELILPDSLQAVGNYAAMYCKNLQKVTFGKDIKIIGVSSFESNGNNSNFTGEGSLEEIVFNGVPEVISMKAFYFNDKLTEIIIPDGIKKIENWAFAKCYKAEKIVLGEGLEYIGDHAFLKCHNVKEVRISDSCKTIQVSAFYQCKALEKLTLGNGIEVIEKGAFEECAALKSVVIPSEVKRMDPYVFYNCTALEECVFKGSPETMEKDIFTGDKDVVITAPEGSSALLYAEENSLQVK